MFWWRKGIHKLRFLMKNWSSEKDREYHDDIFQSTVEQPFRFSYTGYITIRRFADLASPIVQDSKRVLDMGCGTGEITCELARRFPHIGFTGVDHSSSGIDQARKHARFFDLNNIRFQEAQAETYIPSESMDVVVMFDAFHHLEKPQRFVKRMGKYTSRFMLIEPKGDWKGSWDKTLDLDWMIWELDKVQKRLALAVEENENLAEGAQPRLPRGESVEYRYSVQDFKRIFKGYGLKLRGTVSGLDEYPPGSSAAGSLRELWGKWVYQLFKDIDDYVYQNNLDFWAKHWVIEAQKGREHQLRKPSLRPRFRGLDLPNIQGPYQALYKAHDRIKDPVFASSNFKLQVSLRNTGFLSWSSQNPERPVFISYHWRERSGKTLVYDGKRTPFPKEIKPGEEIQVPVSVKAPESQGRFVLEIDCVCEGVTWFSEAKNKTLSIPVQVKKN